ncbi:MAG: hypothetical protein HYY50_05545 [Candidatus Kerfeldbacteria bacterium]|nr:hypothetical protein [Candidatus Kerfeldbacteria bacterium]
MVVKVVNVHPDVTMVASGQRQVELPTSWFPSRPKPGQTWEVMFNRRLHEHEKIERLNELISSG